MNGSENLSVVIVEDEPLARARLRRLLGGCPGVAIVGEGSTGSEALSLVETQRPDLVFLDIHLPDMSGLDVARSWVNHPTPAVVFVTAHGDYAVQAFELHALHYLLKPFDAARLNESLQRARAGLVRKHIEDTVLRAIQASIERIQADTVRAAPPAMDPARARVPIKTAAGEFLLLAAHEIEWIEAADNYVHVHAGSANHLVRETLGTLASRLGSERFMRIHRGTIVNLDRVRKLKAGPQGDLEVHLADGTRLRAGPSYRQRLIDRWRVPHAGSAG